MIFRRKYQEVNIKELGELPHAARAQALMEMMPWIEDITGKTVVIKYGGAAMVQAELREAVVNDLIMLKLMGANPVIVHGGGPAITEMMGRMGIPVRWENGQRVTDEATMEVAKMTLVGKVNQELVRAIKRAYPDCAVTLSVGEKDRATYQAWFDAGADRYLLRHETADEGLYRRLHPEELSLQNRMRCLRDLKDIGYQVGCGFMVGAPFQTPEMLLKDLRFLQSFQPHMVGIGPFIPHRDTPFRDCPPGTAQMTLRLLAIIRLMLPHVLLPHALHIHRRLHACHLRHLRRAHLGLHRLLHRGDACLNRNSLRCLT